MSVIINRIRSRLLEKNQNYIACVVGGTGSGKSYSALKIACSIDPEFTIDQACFNAREFINKIEDKTLKKGACIVFDEAGVELDARSWQSLSNKLFSYILQTFRHQNYAVIFTMPSLAFLDVNARRLLHGIFITQGIDRVKEQVSCKYFEVSVHPQKDKTYQKYPRTRKLGGNVRKIMRISIGIPDFKLVNEYEKKKKEFTKTLKKDVTNELAKIEEKKVPKKPNMTCHICGHSWYYKGSSRMAHCPSCDSRTTTSTTTTHTI